MTDSSLSSEVDPQRVAVVGGGIAGLAAAFRLKQAGCDVTVFEQDAQIGGRMRTVERNGYRVDLAASFLSTCYREMLALIRDAGLDDLIEPTSDVVGFVRDRKVHRIRSHAPQDLLRTPLLGWRSKAALIGVIADKYRNRRLLDWTDPSKAAALDVESITSYARRRRVPNETIKFLIDPVSMEFCLAAADELSVVNLYFFLHMAVGNGFFNSSSGIRFLPEALSRGVKVELSSRVVRVEDGSAGTVVTWQREGEAERTVQLDGTVIAVPAPAALAIVDQLSDYQREFLTGLQYTRGVAVALGYNRAPAEPSIWVTVPPSHHAGLAGMILDHNKAPGRAPAGHGLISTYWHRDWHERHWDLHDDKVIEDAVSAVATVLPDLPDHLEMSVVHRWDPYAIAWPVGSFRALNAFNASLVPTSRVQLAGDYFSFECTNSSLASGERAAARLISAIHGGLSGPAPQRATAAP